MTGQRYVLVADDEPHMRRVLEIMLRQAGHTVFAAANGREALECLAREPIDLLITDLRMPEIDGLALLARMRAEGITTPAIVITAHGSVESAVEAMKLGARDYLLRPFDIPELEIVIERVLGEAEISRQNAFLREELARGWGGFIGVSAPMQAIYEQIRQVAPTRATVLVTGETGTGKELVARAIHDASPRRDKLFVPINCAAIPAEMLEAELFGHEKGAFTGALRERVGKFELASGGTLFLDELTEMPAALQAKLLRVLQEGVIERLGSNRSIALDVRIVAATNRDPRQAIAEGRLREDLYYRLNVFGISLPPLRERVEDLPALIAHFAERFGMPCAPLDAALLARLQAYAWPGNVRELQNVVERALVLAGQAALRADHFPQEIVAPAVAVSNALSPVAALAVRPLEEAVAELESALILAALRQSDDNKPRAAALLGISERTLWYKIKKYAVREA